MYILEPGQEVGTGWRVGEGNLGQPTHRSRQVQALIHFRLAGVVEEMPQIYLQNCRDRIEEEKCWRLTMGRSAAGDQEETRPLDAIN